MVYLFYGSEAYLINAEIKKILLTNMIDKIDTINYDLERDLVEDIIEDAGMMSLFGAKKAIICVNSYLFTGKNNVIEHNLEVLEHYLMNINLDTILFFLVDSEKLDERRKIVKLIKEKAIVKAYNIGNSNLNMLVKDMFDDYKISSSSINLLIERVGKNLDILNQEVNKLKLYRYDEASISEKDIIDLSSINIETDIFIFIDSIVSKDKEKAMTMYQEMLKLNEEPIKIIVMLANQFRIMYQAKELAFKGQTEALIASNLEIHPYRIKLALEKGRNYKSSVLLSYLNDLADLDSDIKSGNIDKYLGLELFILGL